MKTLIALAAASLFLTVYAFAGVTGNWTGAGTMQMTGMPAMSCERVTLDLTDTGSTLEIRQYSFDCSGTHQEISPMTLELRGGSYYAGNQKVGERQGDKVTITFVDPQSHATITNVFEPSGNALKLRYEMSANGFDEKISADLHQ